LVSMVSMNTSIIIGILLPTNRGIKSHKHTML
jgi:hypothetical protein